jgi:hypothetical protein
VEFVRLPTFERTAAGLFSELDVLELELALLANPAAGDLIPAGHGLRKLRRPLAGRGKRSGARVIYYHISTEGRIYLVFAYAKNAQKDLTRVQLKRLAQLISTP